MVDNSNSYKDRVSRLISWGHWFMFANILLAMVMAVRYVFAIEPQFSLITLFYVIATWIGHFGLLGILAYIIVLFPLTFIFPSSKIMRALGAVLATVVIVALLVDGSVFQNYQLHLNLLAFDLDGFNLNNSIGWSSIGLFLLALLLVELTIANLIWKRIAIIRGWDVGNKLTLFFGAAFVISHLVHVWADATVYRPILSYDRMFPLSHQSTARSVMKKYGWLGDQHESEVDLSNDPIAINYPINPLQCNAPTQHNLLFVTIASINAAHVTQQLMPNLYALGQQNINAKAHITTSLSRVDVDFTLTTGLPAQFRSAFEETGKVSPLATLTQANNHMSFGVTGDPRQIVNNESAAAHDARQVEALILWLGSQQAPYFANLDLIASQELSVPKDFSAAINFNDDKMSAAERLLATQYLSALAYTDKLLGQLLAAIDLTTTTLVITGSRGNDLSSIYLRSNAFSAINLAVPLTISIPNTPAQQITKMTSHYDVLPTLLRHHFKCGNPPSDISIGYDVLSTQGDSLFYIGAGKQFALYQQNMIAEIDRQGNYRFHDDAYQRIDDGKLSFQQLIDLMGNINRFN